MKWLKDMLNLSGEATEADMQDALKELIAIKDGAVSETTMDQKISEMKESLKESFKEGFQAVQDTVTDHVKVSIDLATEEIKQSYSSSISDLKEEFAGELNKIKSESKVEVKDDTTLVDGKKVEKAKEVRSKVLTADAQSVDDFLNGI